MSSPERRTLVGFLTEWIGNGGGQVGQVLVSEAEGKYHLRHVADAEADLESLTLHTAPNEARAIGLNDAEGKFRPLKSAPTLKSGWRVELGTIEQVQEALDYFYPAALGNWVRYEEGHVSGVDLRETLSRQTGMYRVTGLIQDAEMQTLVGDACGPGNCFRKILWNADVGQPFTTLPAEKLLEDPSGGEIPVLCCEACPLLVAAARKVVKKRMAEEQKAKEAAEAEGG